MGLNTAGINAILDDGNEAVVWIALGNGATSGSQVSSARVQLTSSVSGGVITATGVPYAFTGTPSAAVSHVLFFSASTSGTFYGFHALGAGDDLSFNVGGNYNLTSIVITGSSPV